ncbi:hypothetical protein J7E99_30660 [Streptomyces sp. ISL-44]|uniref:hypothetical protein n=1 Tax=Streptomyces sp. ISL-44 TaxID=2819184 RepID=UPI001BE57B90|nr:hypothetical protein [Streptomyces sp. ISL-44]MBT2544949.1 hypothetical protein [Streptomyces sp. ISL-44]
MSAQCFEGAAAQRVMVVGGQSVMALEADQWLQPRRFDAMCEVGCQPTGAAVRPV